MPDLGFPDAPWLLVLGEIALIPLLGLALAHRLRRHPARAHAVVVGALAATILCPIATLLAHAGGFGVLPGEHVAPAASAATPLDGGVAPTPAAWPHLVAIGVALAWSLTVTIGLGRMIHGFVRGCRAALRGTACTSVRLTAALARAGAVTGCAPRDAVLVHGDEMVSPAVFAWSRPVRILMPMHAIELADDQLEAILVHELAHWRRRDHWWQLLAETAVALLPWHPAFWMLRRSIETLADRACDAWVVGAGHRADRYADVLLRFVRDRHAAFPAVAALGRRGALRHRMQTLLTGSPPPARCGRGWLGGAFAITLCAGASIALAQPRSIRIDRSDPALAAQLAAAPIQAVPAIVDMGRVPPGETGRGEIRLVNLGDRPVRIITTKPSCGCTTLGPFEPRTLHPGDACTLAVTMTAPKAVAEEKIRTVTFDFEGQEPLAVSLRLITGE